MAGTPITWRNVNTGNDGGNRLLANAANAFGNSTNTLLGVLSDQQKLARQNDALVTQSNTQDYLDKVGSVLGGDPNKLADPDVQANLEKLRLSYGNNIDREQARKAVPQMLLQQQQLQENNWKFKGLQEEEQQRPLVDQYQALLRSGDEAGAKQLLDTTQFRDEDKLTSALERSKAARLSQTYAANNEARAVEDQSMQRQGFATSQAGAALSQQATRQSMDYAKSNQAWREEDREFQQNGREAKVSLDYLDAKDTESKATYAAIPKPLGVPSSAPMQDTNDLLKELPKGAFDSWLGTDEGNRTRATKTISGLLVKGVDFTDENGKVQHADVSKDFVQQALNVVGNNSNITRGGMVADIEPYIKNMLESNPELQRQVKVAQKAKDDFQLVSNKLNAARSRVKSQAFVGQSDILKTLTGFGQPVEKKDD